MGAEDGSKKSENFDTFRRFGGFELQALLLKPPGAQLGRFREPTDAISRDFASISARFWSPGVWILDDFGSDSGRLFDAASRILTF